MPKWTDWLTAVQRPSTIAYGKSDVFPMSHIHAMSSHYQNIVEFAAAEAFQVQHYADKSQSAKPGGEVG